MPIEMYDDTWSKNAEALTSCMNLIYERKFIQGLFMDNHTYIILYLCIQLYVMHMYYVYVLSWEKNQRKGVKAQKSAFI